ncbi:hypothetical protein M885DRAFT_583314 [Pelagophyceae sp. CCMP2097]|nr:hypothetical protein M885DRAFT_583314 [Pelagophyceae sp. CCMP2097]
MAASPLDDGALQQLYSWIDEIPLSRPKRNIGRDFADGVLVAEVVAHYFPRLVELHNYPAANSMQQKLYNWDTLNGRVLRKFGAAITRAEIEAACQCAPGAIEKILHGLQLKMARHRAGQRGRADGDGSPRSTIPRGRGCASGRGDEAYRDTNAVDKEQEIVELRETVDILEQKIAKLEQLVRLKDSKIIKLKEGPGR